MNMGKWICPEAFQARVPTDVRDDELQRAYNQYESQNAHTHWMARASFEQKNNAPVTLLITADDAYKVWINGVFVAQGPAPGFYFAHNVDTLDISAYVREGRNVIAVEVYYQGLINRVWFSADDRMGLSAAVYSGDELLVQTGEGWRGKVSEAYIKGIRYGYATQYTEHYDSRLEEKGWREADFDDGHWDKAMVRETDHTFVPSPIKVVSTYRVEPASMRRVDGAWQYDFGEEIVGCVGIRASGPAGEAVRILCAEELKADGHALAPMLCNCNYVEDWTLSGDECVLEQYEYKGMRYIEVAAPEGVVIHDVWVDARHYPFEDDKSELVADHPFIGKVFDICKNAVKWSTQEGFLDCPTREKGQYSGDMSVTGQAHFFLTGKTDLFKKALVDFANGEKHLGYLPCVAPSSLIQTFADYELQYPYHLLLYYQNTGDLALVRELLPVARRAVDSYIRYERADGMVEKLMEKCVLIDWPHTLRDGYDGKAHPDKTEDCISFINGLYIGAKDWLNELSRLCGEGDVYDTAPLKARFIELFYRPEVGLFADQKDSGHFSLHANLFPAIFGFHPETGHDRLAAFLLEKGLVCGVYMALFALKTCAAIGRFDALWQLLTNTTRHSWYHMLEGGATTAWEAWDEGYKNNISRCHPWASAPITVLAEDIAGIRCAKPGWRAVRFAPHIPDDVATFDLRLPLPLGEVRVVKKDGQTSIHLPDGVVLEA